MQRIHPFDHPILAHDQHLFMLPDDLHLPLLILDEGEGQVFIGLHPLNVFVHSAVQSLKKDHRVGFTVFDQGNER